MFVAIYTNQWVTDKIGETKVVNPGMLSKGYACMINIDDSDEENIKVNPEIIKL